MRQNEETKADSSSSLVVAFLYDALANLGVDESTMSVRLSPKTFAAIEVAGKWLCIVSVSFYFGMLAVYHEPTSLEKAIHRMELRSQLLAEERSFEKEVRQKNGIASNASDVAASQKD